MKNALKRIMSMLLCFALLFGIMPNTLPTAIAYIGMGENPDGGLSSVSFNNGVSISEPTQHTAVYQGSGSRHYKMTGSDSVVMTSDQKNGISRLSLGFSLKSSGFSSTLSTVTLDDGTTSSTLSPSFSGNYYTATFDVKPASSYNLSFTIYAYSHTGYTYNMETTSYVINVGICDNYNVKFHSNDGVDTTSNQTISYNQTTPLNANTFARRGYIFKGWATSPTGSVVYTDKQSVKNLRSTDGATIDLYAVWQKVYTLSFDRNGIDTTTFPSAQSILSGERASKPEAPTATGYTFLDWYVDHSSSIKYSFSDPMNADLTIFAKWKSHTYTVHYDPNNGSGSMRDSIHTYGIEQPLSSNAFHRAGYTFKGWAISPTGEATYHDTQSVTNLSITDADTVTLFAVWEAIPAVAPTITGTSGNQEGVHTYTTGDLRISVAATPAPDHALTYQWYEGDTKIDDANAAEYILPAGAAANAHTYHCVITATRTDNGLTKSITSDKLNITIHPAPPTIDYRTETLTLPTLIEYRISSSGDWSTVPDLSKHIPHHDEAAATIEYRVRAHDTVAASTTRTLTLPARRSAPQLPLPIFKSDTVINAKPLTNCEYGITDQWRADGTFRLTPDTAYVLLLRYAATDTAFASDSASCNIRTLRTDGTGKLDKNEAVQIDGVRTESDGSHVLFGKADITLPLDVKSADVDSKGIFVPKNTAVKTPTRAVILPTGGKIFADSTIEAYGKLLLPPYLFIAPKDKNIIVHPDGGITVPDGTIIRIGDKEIHMDKGGKITVNPDGSLLLPDKSTLHPNGTVISPYRSSSDMRITLLPTSPNLPFNDVQPTDWFYPSIRYAYENHLMDGTSEATFSPTSNTSRAMLVTVAYRNSQSPSADLQPYFTDVSTETWYSKAVSWGAALGVVRGYGDGTFAPDVSISREELATVLYRYYKGIAYDRAILEQYPDHSEVQPWAVDAMTWALEHGILQGDNDGLLHPHTGASRAEIAAIFQRVASKTAK